MSKLYINRETAYSDKATRIKTWFVPSADYKYADKNMNNISACLEYKLLYVDVYIKLQNNATLDDMIEEFFYDFLSLNEDKIVKMMTYAKKFKVDNELRSMLNEIRDFIAVMLQSISKN